MSSGAAIFITGPAGAGKVKTRIYYPYLIYQVYFLCCTNATLRVYREDSASHQLGSSSRLL